MSAVEELREAARLMRERAQASGAALAGGPWTMDGLAEAFVEALHGDPTIGDPEAVAAADADHYAPWLPAVALAVADWLDDNAREIYCAGPREAASALAVARAYLGGTGA